MKKLLFIVLLFISFQSFAQVVQYPTNYGIGYRRVGGDTLLWCPIDTFSVPASLSSKGHLARKGTTLYYWNGAAWAAFAGGGGGTYYNANVGSAYRLAIPNTSNIKTLSAKYGIILDSATSNEIGVKFDSATVFPQIRATLPTPTWQQVLTSGSRLTTTNSINGAGYNFTWDSLGNYTQYIRGAGKQFTFNTYNNSNSLTSDFEQYEGGFYLSGTEPVSGNDIWFNMETNNVGGTFEVIDAGTYGNSYLTNYGSNSTYETQHYLEDITSTNRKYSGIYQKIGVNNNTTFYTQIENVISNKVYNQIYMDSLNGIQLQTKTALANTYKGLKIDKTHQVFIDSMATGGASADSVVVITSGGQLKKRNASAFAGGGGGSPAGNYGNLQINRNGAFDSPSTDSLGYTTSGGLAVKNKITATTGGTFNSSNSATGDFVVNGQTVNSLFWTDASADEVYIGTTTDNGAYKLQVGGGIYTPAVSYNGGLQLAGGTTQGIEFVTGGDILFSLGSSGFQWGFNGSNLATDNNNLITWNPTVNGVYGGGPDLGIGRNAAGVMEINNGTLGSVRDLKLRSIVTTGSTTTTYISKAVDYTATSDDNIIEVTATGKTITLPTAASISGRTYTIKLTASGTGTVATTSSQTIDGSTTYSLSAQYKYVTVVSNGSNWIITANN